MKIILVSISSLMCFALTHGVRKVTMTGNQQHVHHKQYCKYLQEFAYKKKKSVY